MTDDLLTLSETAALLKMESHSVSKLIRIGLLPSLRLGPRTVRVPRRLLLERLEEMAGAMRDEAYV
jgi:excisionase family DNA binding protein